MLRNEGRKLDSRARQMADSADLAFCVRSLFGFGTSLLPGKRHTVTFRSLPSNTVGAGEATFDQPRAMDDWGCRISGEWRRAEFPNFSVDQFTIT
jgi:hypothetical protein